MNTVNEKCDDNHYFTMFKADVICHDVDVHVCANKSDKLLVDCGAIVRIIHDKSKFVKLDDNCNAQQHSVELADGSRSSDVVQGKGFAQVKVYDCECKYVALSRR